MHKTKPLEPIRKSLTFASFRVFRGPNFGFRVESEYQSETPHVVSYEAHCHR